jgi:hypothetical protein
MLKTIQKYFNRLIIPICFIIGLIRQLQIQNYEASIGKPTMSGCFALFSYTLVGLFLVIISLTITGFYHCEPYSISRIILSVIILFMVFIVVFLLLISH